MTQFKLEYSKKQKMQISNDAFFYLLEEEEMIDEKNLGEAQKILEMFPDGFYIEETWKPIKNSGYIECVFIPYVEKDIDFDKYLQLTSNTQMQIKCTSADTIKAWFCNVNTGEREFQGEFKVYTNDYGHKCFHTGDQSRKFEAGKMSLYFLKHFKDK